jgi:hypothetical protein
MRAELLNKWLKEINILIIQTEKLPDKVTRDSRINKLNNLKRDLIRVRDGVN